MTHLRIEQGGTTEYVTSTLIHKLYEYAKEIKDYEEDPLNNVTTSQVSLKGNLSVPKAYGDEVDWLETKFSPDLHITITQGRYIKFADSEVERVLLTQYGDGIGITVGDMSNATRLSDNLFQNNSNINTFNELSQFTSITTLGLSVFQGCTNLTSVDLSRCTTIGNRAFYGCSALTSITGLQNVAGLSNVTGLGEYAFSGCTNLASEINLSSCTSIGQYAFNNCSSLTSITLPNRSINIPYRCFDGDSSLTTINNSSSIQHFRGGAFRNCSNLTSLDLSNVVWSQNPTKDVIESGSATNTEASPFYQCTSLRDIGVHTIPGITNLGSRAFDAAGIEGVYTFPDVQTICKGRIRHYAIAWCHNITKLSFPSLLRTNPGHPYQASTDGCIKQCNGLKILDLGSNLQSMGQRQFDHLPALEAVLINVSTPPSITEVSSGSASSDSYNSKTQFFGNSTCKIYVPDAAVTTYQSTYPYSLFAADILPMSDYNEASILGTTT